MNRLGPVSALVMMMMAATGCGGKEAECKTLVGSMRNLGRKLAAAQSVTSSENAGAQHVAKALRTFAQEATNTGNTLADASFTVPALGRIAADASSAALSLAESATKMVEAAEHMRGLDPARHAVRIQRTLADVAATNIRGLCSSSPLECSALSSLLLSRPPFPDTAVDPARATAWTEQATAWVNELAALELANSELKLQVANLGKTTKSFAAALSTLAAGNDSTKELTAATTAFSSQVASVSAAMTAAQDLCKQ